MMRTSKFLALVMASMLALASSASAITLRITDRDLQGLIAQGESNGNRLNLRVAAAASGPVMVFIYDGGTVTSYRAVLRGDQILLEGQPETSLSKLLAGRGFSLTTEVVESTAPRTFNFPGLNTTQNATPSSTPASGTSSGPASGSSPASGSGNGGNSGQGGNGNAGANDKGKDNGKDKEKEKDKGKGKP
ncbi:hypothetical protein [Deinococcus peraridilitoris]|uniref:Uncharacterized protein n=1 Tax=Deinococcus peraridilitoris (strain DSM 19664 / LMG 22246 / CIP 109416 / KR-200) TaxID=937777 RepID=L0A1T5_DEIPD|nr:hypothetical protein [Deinococcus peraridilitoris]AFZ67806.1 hypothetical protein Deipe_2326 [Deinococcus peraridilitoris DSM 19664]